MTSSFCDFTKQWSRNRIFETSLELEHPSDTMLQSHLIQLLKNDHLVVNHGHESCPSGNVEKRESAEGNPFNFTPQLIHLNKDHEYFEVTQQ